MAWVDKNNTKLRVLAIDRFMPIDAKPGRWGGYKKYDVFREVDNGR